MDEFNLDRFLESQRFGYEAALQEIKNGNTENYWIWHILPRLKGLGTSPNSNYYGITGMEEAKAYLEHPILGARLREACTALLEQSSLIVNNMFREDDDFLMLCSSMTLFDAVSPNDVFDKVLKEILFNRKDRTTMRMLGTPLLWREEWTTEFIYQEMVDYIQKRAHTFDYLHCYEEEVIHLIHKGHLIQINVDPGEIYLLTDIFKTPDISSEDFDKEIITFHSCTGAPIFSYCDDIHAKGYEREYARFELSYYCDSIEEFALHLDQWLDRIADYAERFKTKDI